MGPRYEVPASNPEEAARKFLLAAHSLGKVFLCDGYVYTVDVSWKNGLRRKQIDCVINLKIEVILPKGK